MKHFSSCRCLGSILSFLAVQSAGCVARTVEVTSHRSSGVDEAGPVSALAFTLQDSLFRERAAGGPARGPFQSHGWACRKSHGRSGRERMLLCISAHPNTERAGGKKGRLWGVGGGLDGGPWAPHHPPQEPALSDPGGFPAPCTLKRLYIRCVSLPSNTVRAKLLPSPLPTRDNTDTRGFRARSFSHAASVDGGPLWRRPPSAHSQVHTGHFFHAPGRHTEEV